MTATPMYELNALLSGRQLSRTERVGLRLADLLHRTAEQRDALRISCEMSVMELESRPSSDQDAEIIKQIDDHLLTLSCLELFEELKD